MEAAGRRHRPRAAAGAGPRGRTPIVCYRHHESHAASAFLPSPYESAAVLCVDGVGEWATTSLWRGTGQRVEPLAELRFPHSLGLLYSAFTYFCGFKVDSGEYKLMGLAPYGKPTYAPLIRERLVDVKPDGSFRLDMRYFDFPLGRVMTGRAFEKLFDGPAGAESPLTEREFDLAASVQQVTEEIMLRLARTARERTGESRLCLAGGVALNCVANGRVVEEGSSTRSGCSPRRATPVARWGGAAGRSGAEGGPTYVRGVTRCVARGWGPGSPTTRSGRTWRRPVCRTPGSLPGAVPRGRGGVGRGQGRRLVPGPLGVRPARAGLPFHPWRRA
ncbi:carbamoyltransferase N-terminal domain-containing protein [Streptomyces sp. M19]